MKILLVGGGSGGSVSPLLALAEEIKNRPEHERAEFLFVGGRQGPELNMAESAKINFASISAARYRRFFTLKNLAAPFLFTFGFFQAVRIIRLFKPNIVVGTGSFVQVPLLWAAAMLRVPYVIHQQDVLPGLANRLCEMWAAAITVTFQKSLKDFPSGTGLEEQNKQKVFWIGNPTLGRSAPKLPAAEARRQFNFSDSLPTLLVTGGGTGALAINNLIRDSLLELGKIVQIIHQTGKGKALAVSRAEHYRQFEFIQDMAAAYQAADLVVARAGLSTIAELSLQAKPAIIIPMPHSHQIHNADLLARARAALVLPQELATPETFVKIIRKLLFNLPLQQELAKNISGIMPHDAAKRMADIVLKCADKNFTPKKPQT